MTWRDAWISVENRVLVVRKPLLYPSELRGHGLSKTMHRALTTQQRAGAGGSSVSEPHLLQERAPPRVAVERTEPRAGHQYGEPAVPLRI